MDRELDPRSDEAESLMISVGAEPHFVTLCRAQASFRARLTPKPWRCGVPSPSCSFPFEDAPARQEFTAWLAKYEAAIAGHATCRYVEQVGSGPALDLVRPIVELHDRRARASESLPLA